MKEHDEKKFNKFCKKLIKSTEMFTCVENSIEGEEDKEEIAYVIIIILWINLDIHCKDAHQLWIIS